MTPERKLQQIMKNEYFLWKAGNGSILDFLKVLEIAVQKWNKFSSLRENIEAGTKWFWYPLLYLSTIFAEMSETTKCPKLQQEAWRKLMLMYLPRW